MFRIIPQNHCRVIERFGKPARVQQAGLKFHVPILEQYKSLIDWGDRANKQGEFIELTEQIMDTKPRECITRDNAKVLADCVISWRIVDPLRAVYEVDQLFDSLTQAALNIMRSEIGAQELDVLLQSRMTLNESISSKLTQTCGKWGIQLLRVELQELKTDDDTSKAMLQQLDAERRSRALALEAEGEAKATLTRARADRDAAILRAEGQAKALEISAAAEKSYLETLAQTIGADKANNVLLVQKAIEGYNVISGNAANKVFLPANTQTLLGETLRGNLED